MSLQKIGYSLIGVGGFIVLSMLLGKGGLQCLFKSLGRRSPYGDEHLGNP